MRMLDRSEQPHLLSGGQDGTSVALCKVGVLLEAENAPQQHEADDGCDDCIAHPPHNLQPLCTQSQTSAIRAVCGLRNRDVGGQQQAALA